MATVVVRSADGAGPDQGFRGTGFYVAPRTVLTAAHVVRGQTDLAVHSVAREETGIWKARVRSALDTQEPPQGIIPVEQDLALLELVDDPGDHECAWLTDRAAWHGGRLAGYACVSEPSTRQPVLWSATLEVNARTGPYGCVSPPPLTSHRAAAEDPWWIPAPGMSSACSRPADRAAAASESSSQPSEASAPSTSA
ncbi:S1 family peptidase [Streptomyces kunmingensis]|uniref:S1 family peptidase n=1 Tax=Streptomyces kunmingensis TaxID=68225 RepID=UPI003983B5C0